MSNHKVLKFRIFTIVAFMASIAIVLFAISRYEKTIPYEFGEEDYVYYSTSPDAYTYHIYEDCKSLQRTTYPIEHDFFDSDEIEYKDLCQVCQNRAHSNFINFGYWRFLLLISVSLFGVLCLLSMLSYTEKIKGLPVFPLKGGSNPCSLASYEDIIISVDGTKFICIDTKEHRRYLPETDGKFLYDNAVRADELNPIAVMLYDNNGVKWIKSTDKDLQRDTDHSSTHRKLRISLKYMVQFVVILAIIFIVLVVIGLFKGNWHALIEDYSMWMLGGLSLFWLVTFQKFNDYSEHNRIFNEL